MGSRASSRGAHGVKGAILSLLINCVAANAAWLAERIQVQTDWVSIRLQKKRFNLFTHNNFINSNFIDSIAPSRLLEILPDRIGIPILIAQGEYSSTAMLIASIVALIIGGAGIKLLDILRKRDIKTQSQAMLDQAKANASNIVREAELEAKEKALQQKQHMEQEVAKLREAVRKKESALDRREETLLQTTEDVRKQEKMVEANQRRLSDKLQEATKRSEDLQRSVQEQSQQLQRISGLSREEARTQLLSLLEKELEQDVGNQILKHERRVTEIAEQKSQEIILTAMQRYAAAHTADSTTSTVDIPNDEMKGRIIGREGRNIRAFEKATGVDVIIDDTPGVVIVSGFDPVRREVARQSLDKLIADGRIHPSRIEEIVQQTEKELEVFIRRKGQEALEEVNVGGAHERVVYLLGRLHFRTSFSQNVLRHSVEVAFISGLMAEMIGLETALGSPCGFAA